MDNIKMDLNYTGREDTDFNYLTEYGSVDGSYEHSNEHVGSMNGR
jgi:hypothetical protein